MSQQTADSVAAGHDADNWDGLWDEFAARAEKNPAQNYRREVSMRLLEQDGVPQRLVDIGCGQGDFLRDATKKWPNTKLVGVDASQRGLDDAKRKAPNAELVLADLTAGPADAGEFAGFGTHALCSEVIEHVDDPVACLRNARPFLAPGALVVVTVPGGQMSAFDRHIGHRQHFDPAKLARIMEEAGFVDAHAMRAGFPFMNLYRRLVIMRGDKLITDASEHENGEGSLLMRATMAFFRPLMRLNRDSSKRGVQIIGIAREPK